MLVTVLPSLQDVMLMHFRGHGCLGLDDALFCCLCLFTRAKNTLVRTTRGVVTVIFSAFTVVLAKGWRVVIRFVSGNLFL